MTQQLFNQTIFLDLTVGFTVCHGQVKKDLPKERTGYKGRMGIYEVLKNSESVQKMIVANSTSEEIQKQAITEGMVTMQLDGLVKAMLGMTSIEEIVRVTRE